jgi:hypothetical protein
MVPPAQTELRAFLAGAAVQRVDVGARVVLLRVRLPGETRFVIVATGKRGGVGVVAERPWRGAGLPGGSAPEGRKMRIRAALEGARIASAGERRVLIDRGETGYLLEALAGEGAAVALREVSSELPLDAPAATREALEAEGARLAPDLAEGALAARKQELARALARALSRVGRRIEAVRGDLARIGEADGIASLATLLVADAARAPRGATRLSATDWSTGEPRPVELAIDPSRSAREQVDAMFKRARRLKQGAAIARKRLQDAEAAAARLACIGARAGAAGTPAAVDALAGEARAAAPRDFALATAAGGGAAKHAPEPARPYRTFRGGAGERILVGRGAAYNDALTFHVARPQDLWLHVKGRAGAHVIVPLDKNRACPSDLLIDAAHLAAHFSDARGEVTVEIQHTPRRYLRKPRGSAPGLVVVDREKVTVLRVEADRLSRLLSTEEP